MEYAEDADVLAADISRRDGQSFILGGQLINQSVSRFGLAVRRWAGKLKGLGSIPLRLSFLFENVLVCGHSLVALFLTVKETLKWLSSLRILMQGSFRW